MNPLIFFFRIFVSSTRIDLSIAFRIVDKEPVQIQWLGNIIKCPFLNGFNSRINGSMTRDHDDRCIGHQHNFFQHLDASIFGIFISQRIALYLFDSRSFRPSGPSSAPSTSYFSYCKISCNVLRMLFHHRLPKSLDIAMYYLSKIGKFWILLLYVRIRKNVQIVSIPVASCPLPYLHLLPVTVMAQEILDSPLQYPWAGGMNPASSARLTWTLTEKRSPGFRPVRQPDPSFINEAHREK